MGTYAEIIKYIEEKESLPEGFDKWALADNQGWTVAHEAARYGLLPEGFNQWGLKESTGWTVAHSAAYKGNLPGDFAQWEMANSSGLTVAHNAATTGHLPKNFHQWDLKTNRGKTVFEEALSSKREFLADQFTDWDMVINENGETCRDVYERFKGEE